MDPYCAFPPPPNQPVYVEFSIGDCGDKLGIIDRKYGLRARRTRRVARLRTGMSMIVRQL
jgi:hypothetical protein